MSEEQTKDGGAEATKESQDGATDWKSVVIPNDADGPAKSYAGKTIGEFLDANSSLNRSFQEKSEALKARERELEEARSEIERLKPKETKKAPKQDKEDAPARQEFDPANPPKGFVHKDEFAKALHRATMEYLGNDGLSRETAEEVEKFGLMDRSDLADFLELRRNQRNDIAEKFADSIPEFDLMKLEEWITSNEAPYSKEAARGMLEMIQQKRTGWIPEVWQDMQSHVERGGRFTGGHSGKTYGHVEPVIRGDPSGGHANPGFQSKEEYDKAMAEAQEALHRGNKVPLNAVREKYEKTPERIRATFY